MHAFICFFNSIEFTISFDLVSENGIVVFRRNFSTFFIGELLSIAYYFIPLAQAQTGIGEKAQQTRFKFGMHMIKFPKNECRSTG